MTAERSHWEGGRRVNDWRLAPVRCFGGFRLEWERWVLTDEGWDLEERDPLEGLYSDEDSARLALDAAAAEGQS